MRKMEAAPLQGKNALERQPSVVQWVIDTLKRPVLNRRLAQINLLADTLLARGEELEGQSDVEVRKLDDLPGLSVLISKEARDKMTRTDSTIYIARDEYGIIKVEKSVKTYEKEMDGGYKSYSPPFEEVFNSNDPANGTLSLGETVRDLQYARNQLGIPRH